MSEKGVYGDYFNYMKGSVFHVWRLRAHDSRLTIHDVNRFPKNFMFRLTETEVEFMVSQIAIPSKQALGGHLPYVFTEHVVLMLANILKSDQAIRMSIRIIEIFVILRERLLTHKDILLQLEKLEKQTTTNSTDITMIFKVLKQLIAPTKKKRELIGFKTSSTRKKTRNS